ncbi:dTDP-4-amino-4,6-dideoxygalactose transaminase [Clostridium isatidis]|uniref:dTDP-4-amino-4,6-dideoxygalactose transaminase n=1 Tax=Clostridium isatidis TaxID=182773 RepID=A0A343JA98_9CLOT|nr:dTDP-4-amino-4,6-dideoxygalactose transaminase [Clostridium isatidis]ASW42456.1 dTDP-4-amino-4,6-dideoxygalactose transaminase [Clostridium isatidis]
MISFNKPYYTGKEIEYIEDTLKRNKICGDGYYTKKVSEFMEKTFNTKKALMTTSCSMALDMSCILADIKEGDEVILPSYTFVSTANSIVLRGGKCIFADIDPNTLVIDLEDVEKKITERTKAIIVVHYAGVSCDMDKLMEIANKNNILVIEDAAQAVNAKYKGKYLGTIGHMGCYSFHETKNYVAGEGGALLINIDDKTLIESAEIVREKGTNRSNFYRGQVDKYTWVKMGSSYLPSEMISAFLMAQFEELDTINNLRKEVFNKYYDGTRELEEMGKVRRPIIPDYNDINYHMFYLILNSEKERNNLLEYFKQNDIIGTFHYLPLHTSPMGLEMGYKEGDLPITESISSRLIRLPMYAGLTNEEVDKVLFHLKEFFKK